MKTIVEAAYHAYERRLRGGTPKWEELTEEQRTAWRHAIAEAVEMTHDQNSETNRYVDQAHAILGCWFAEDQIVPWLERNRDEPGNRLLHMATTAVWEGVLR